MITYSICWLRSQTLRSYEAKSIIDNVFKQMSTKYTYNQRVEGHTFDNFGTLRHLNFGSLNNSLIVHSA